MTSVVEVDIKAAMVKASQAMSRQAIGRLHAGKCATVYHSKQLMIVRPST